MGWATQHFITVSVLVLSYELSYPIFHYAERSGTELWVELPDIT
jgi:hypothetical protein